METLSRRFQCEKSCHPAGTRAFPEGVVTANLGSGGETFLSKTLYDYHGNYFNICCTDVEVVAFSKNTASHHASGVPKVILINWCLNRKGRKKSD